MHAWDEEIINPPYFLSIYWKCFNNLALIEFFQWMNFGMFFKAKANLP